jgi:GAF domain-containing protein
VTDHTAETGLGDLSEPLLAEAENLIQGWLDHLERSGDELLASCSRAELSDALRTFLSPVQGRPCEAGLGPDIPLRTLTIATLSLRRRLSATSPKGRSDAEARDLLLTACGRALATADDRGEDDTAETTSLTSLLAEASSKIQRALSDDRVKRHAVEAAVRLCNAETAVWWDQEESHRLRAAAWSGARISRAAASVTLAASFWKMGGPPEGVIRLAEDDAAHKDLLCAVDAKSGLIVRARGGGRWVGALSVHGAALDAERIDLLVSLAQQTGAAAQALELTADKKRLTEVQRRTVSELGFALSSALSLEEFLELVCRSAAELLQADSSLVYLAQPEAEVTLRAVFDPNDLLPRADAAALTTFAEEARSQPAGKPLLRTGLPGGRAPSPARARAVSSIGTALSIRGDPLGALLLFRRRPRAFTATDREIILSFAAQAAVAIENLQLVEDMQRRLLEMADLTWVSTRITSTMEIERIAATVADAASKAVDAPRIALFAMNENGEFAPVPSGQRGLPEERMDPLPSSGHLGAEALSAGVAQMVVDAAREGREGDPLLQWLGVRSVLCAPMVAQQGLQGLLAVGDLNPRDFPSHVVALLSAYANQTALALQSATLYQDVVRHLNELENLFEVSQTLASSLEYTQTLDRVLNAAAELLDAPVGTLMLADPDTEELTIKAARGIRPDHDFYRPLSIGEGLAGKAVQSGEALLSADIRRDGRFSDRSFAREGGLQAAIAAPLITRGRTVGALSLYRRSQREFDEDDRRLVTALSNAAAVAIDNARLYEETQERAQFLTAMVSEINHRVRNTLQAVAGLLRMEMEQTPPRPLNEILRRGIARLQSVAVVHDMLQARDLRFVDIKQAARRIIQLTAQTVMPDSDIETRVSGARVMLPSQQAANVALILGELVDNAVRHGLAGTRGGRVSISLAEAGDNVVLEVKDSGEGLPADFDLDTHSGLGFKVVRGLIEEELGGSLEVESDKGVTVRAKFPKRR